MSAAGAATDDQKKGGCVLALMKEAHALRDRGDARGALAKLEECRACGWTIHDADFARKAEGAVEESLAQMYFPLGQVDEAITHFEQALVISREIGDYIGESRARNGFGNICSSLGQHAKAITEFVRLEVVLCASVAESILAHRQIGFRWLTPR